jgi:small-conductance mechanosensitive channel
MIDVGVLGDLMSNPVFRVCVIVLVAAFLHLAARETIGFFVRRVINAGHRKQSKSELKKRERTLAGMFRTIFGVALWVGVVFLALLQFQINITALLTGAGFLGVIIGLGAQNSIKDFLAGLYIITENQFRIGDIVKIQANGTVISGVVDDISMRVTRLRDLDGNLHIVPNGSIEIVSNLTFVYANVNIDIGVSYESDIDKVEKVMNKVGEDLASDKEWEDKIVEPIKFLRVDRFDASAITIKALGKVKPASQWPVAGEYRRRLKKAFEQNNISIPLPQMVVHKGKG